MIWYSDANCIATGGLQAARHFPSGLKYKRIATRRAHLEQSVLTVINFSVMRDFREVATHQRKVVPLIHLPYRPNSRHDGFVAQLASKRIAGIGGVGDYRSGPHDSGCLPYQTQLGVFRVNRKELSHKRNSGWFL